MFGLVESLESRLFLSASAVSTALHTVATQEALLKADLKAITTTLRADAKLVVADLKRLGVTKTDKPLVKTATTDGKSAFAKLSKDVAAQKSLINKDAKALVGAEKKLAKKPSDATLSAKVTAAQTTLTNDAASTQATINADGNSGVTSISADFTAIGNANSTDSQLQTDVTTTNTDLNTKGQSVGTDDGVLVAADIPNLIAAFSTT